MRTAARANAHARISSTRGGGRMVPVRYWIECWTGRSGAVVRLTLNKEESDMSDQPHRNRSAITGRFVNDAAAARWPKNAVRETPKPAKPSTPPKPKRK